MKLIIFFGVAAAGFFMDSHGARGLEEPHPQGSSLPEPYQFFSNDNLCGPTSLSLAAKRLGIEADTFSIAQSLHLTERGTSLEELMRAAKKLGLRAEAYKLDSAKTLLKQSPGASAIVLLRGNHFALVWPGPSGKLNLAEYPKAVRV